MQDLNLRHLTQNQGCYHLHQLAQKARTGSPRGCPTAPSGCPTALVAAQLAPKRLPNGPKRLPNCPKRLPNYPKRLPNWPQSGCPIAPKRLPNGPKRLPNWPKAAAQKAKKQAENKGFEPSPRRSEDDVSSVAQPTVSDYSPYYCANGQTRTANPGLEDRDFTLTLRPGRFCTWYIKHGVAEYKNYTRKYCCASESRTRSFSLMRAVCYRYTIAQWN
jgi:hypothetical protein